MGSRATIDKWSLKYWITKYFLVKYVHDFYYRKIQVQNPSNIPKNAAVILAPNHQNALMDAMAFVAGIRYQTVFLARADVFTSQFVNRIMTFLKILPIYRIRDGRASLQKNDEIFDLTLNILRNKANPLCMFPEGNHGEKRRLRPLVKGIFRIAFKAQEDYGSKPGVKIIPVGIDYKHYQKFRQTQFINIGKPIEVSEYWDAYTENQAAGMNLLRERLADDLKKLMIHIESEEYYELYMGLRGIYNKVMRKRMNLKNYRLSDQFIADKLMINALDKCLKSDENSIRQLNNAYKEYAGLRDKLKFRDWVASRKKYSLSLNSLALILSLFCTPIALIGLFNNWPHFILPATILKKIKDPQFHSTAKWGAGLVIIIVYYLLIIVLVLIYFPYWWLKLIYIITLPIGGLFALSYRNFIIKTWARIRYTYLKYKKDEKTLRFKSLYDEINRSLDRIMDLY